ncbi:MAG TPA: GNAT family N-acetyltransferase [Candidatus Limnocylindrales bacterium]
MTTATVGEARRPVIRPATEADAGPIRHLIRVTQLNPRDLDWHRFLVADDGGQIVACAQVRVHGAGSRELASVAVEPAREGEGIGRAISEAAISREPVRPLYLYTESARMTFWHRFAFREIEGDDIPRDMRVSVRAARIAMAAVSPFMGRRLRVVVMRRDEP